MTSGASRLRLKRGRANEAITRSFEKEAIARASLNEQKQRNIVSSWESNHMGGSRPRERLIDEAKESNMISLKRGMKSSKLISVASDEAYKLYGTNRAYQSESREFSRSAETNFYHSGISGNHSRKRHRGFDEYNFYDGTPTFCDYERTQPSPKRGHQVHRILPTSSWHGEDETHQDRADVLSTPYLTQIKYENSYDYTLQHENMSPMYSSQSQRYWRNRGDRSPSYFDQPDCVDAHQKYTVVVEPCSESSKSRSLTSMVGYDDTEDDFEPIDVNPFEQIGYRRIPSISPSSKTPISSGVYRQEFDRLEEEIEAQYAHTCEPSDYEPFPCHVAFAVLDEHESGRHSEALHGFHSSTGIAKFQKKRVDLPPTYLGIPNDSSHIDHLSPIGSYEEGGCQSVRFFNDGVEVDDSGRKILSSSSYLSRTQSTFEAARNEIRNGARSCCKSPIVVSKIKQPISPRLSVRSSHDDLLTFVHKRLPEVERELDVQLDEENVNGKYAFTTLEKLLKKLYKLSERENRRFSFKEDKINTQDTFSNKPPLTMRLANCIRSLERLKRSWEQDSVELSDQSSESADSVAQGLRGSFTFNSPQKWSSSENPAAIWNLFGQQVRESKSEHMSESDEIYAQDFDNNLTSGDKSIPFVEHTQPPPKPSKVELDDYDSSSLLEPLPDLIEIP